MSISFGPYQHVTNGHLEYPSRLLIYESGDIRVTWVAFWKSVALLQFGTTVVFGAPVLWNNINQPDPNMRKLHAFIVCLIGAFPTMVLALITSPFVHKVFLQIPEYARRSRKDLMHFVRTLQLDPKGTANTKLEFETLRIFPFRKTTATFLHELRALPSGKLLFANFELVKSKEWAEQRREKGIFKRILEVLNEPRFKFYVKEGRFYTMKTKVPGVWEQVSQRIREQTAFERDERNVAKHNSRRAPVLRRPVRPAMANDAQVVLKRQTSRPSQR